MAKVVESIGKTYDEALKNGLEQIGLTEDDVNIEIIKDASQTKKSFFSILEPRQVKLLITEKTHSKANNNYGEVHEEKEIVELDEETIKKAEEKIDTFLKEYYKSMNLELKHDFKYEKGIIYITISGEGTGLIIGYRGETLEALQTFVGALVNKDSNSRIRLVFDSENYREKRANSLKGLALKEADIVVKKKKSYTFEPMTAFERKAIHTALQNHPKVTTHSVGEEPYRKVVISLK
ncbi:MAG: KH domain-containing protein [Clostridia bacterium]|nr:KH domain-containing protein [Clostridia bacterium]